MSAINHIKFEKLPFVFQLHHEPKNPEDLPDSMPLELQIDEEFGVLQQKYDPVIGDHLTHAYELGSVIGGNTLDDEIGAGYTDCIVSFIREKVCPDGIGENFRVLEVGCGIGFLLKNLKDLGADVTGVEPGAQGVVGAEKYGIPIIKDFFPSDKVVGKFDLIITHCVLEHIVDPRNFIKNFDPFLSENGRVIVSVPNEEPYLACGDISTIFHEHWNYFTIGSFTNLLHGIGVSDLTVERSSHGGLLLSVFKMGGQPKRVDSEITTSIQMNRKYFDFISQTSDRLADYFNSRSDVGVYCPARMVNSIIHCGIDIGKIRFFDDDAYSYGKYYPGIPIKVENRADLISRPPSSVLIMTHFFGEIIKSKIEAHIPPDTEITLWSEIFGNPGSE